MHNVSLRNVMITFRHRSADEDLGPMRHSHRGYLKQDHQRRGQTIVMVIFNGPVRLSVCHWRASKENKLHSFELKDIFKF